MMMDAHLRGVFKSMKHGNTRLQKPSGSNNVIRGHLELVGKNKAQNKATNKNRHTTPDKLQIKHPFNTKIKTGLLPKCLNIVIKGFMLRDYSAW